MRTRFFAPPDRTWGPPSLLYNGCRVFLNSRGGRGVGLTLHPHLVPKVLEKCRDIPFPTLRTCVAHKKGENLPNKTRISRLQRSVYFVVCLCYVAFHARLIYCNNLQLEVTYIIVCILCICSTCTVAIILP